MLSGGAALGRRGAWGLVVLALLCGVPLLFPLDAPWINDEPLLVSLALQANQAGHLAVIGLEASGRPLHYGPFPIWLYQAFFSLSRDIELLVVVRAALMIGPLAWALWSLSRSAQLWLPFSFSVLLSPYLWFYCRSLWDNSFCIPLGALAFACLARFLEKKTAPPLFAVLLLCTLLLMTHLMALAFVGPVIAWLAVAERKSVARLKFQALSSLAICTLIAWPYLRYLLLFNRGTWVSGRSQLAGYWFPLTGGRVLSGAGLDYFWEGDWLALAGWKGTLFTLARTVSMLSYCAVWAGILLGALALIRSTGRALSVRNSLTAVSLIIVAAQSALDGLTGSVFHPHYFNGTFIVLAFLAWLSADALASRGLAVVSWIQTVSLGGILAFLIVQTHSRGGTRGIHYGATLGNQLAVCELLNTSPGGSIDRASVYQYALFPQALNVLRALRPRPQVQVPASRLRLQVVYAAADPRDGHIAVRQVSGP